MKDPADHPEVAPPATNPAIWIVALVAGALCAVNGPSPTGQTLLDVMLVVASVAGVTWFSSVVPIRFAAALALIAGCITLTWPGLVLGVLAYVAASGTAGPRPAAPWVSAALVALALNLAARSDLQWFLGASAIVGVSVAVLAIARAVPARTSRHRRILGAVVGVAVLVAALAGAGLANAGLNSRDDLSDGERTVRRGLDELVAGDVDTAVASFDEAAAAFERANDRLSSPLTALAAVVPVTAQHRRAAVELTGEARRATETLSSELSPINIDELTFAGGRIDVEAIADLSQPLTTVRTDIAGLRTTISDLDDPWLVTPVRDRLERLDDDIQEQLDRSELFVDVVDRAPAMLGLDGPRRYFVAFTTPSEARGLGGFMGNWAEITIDDGAIDLTRFGRSDDLDDAARPGERTVSGPAEWLARYGAFGFDNGPGGGVNLEPWKNITMSASMKSTGTVIAELYPQSGGREVDGVFALDVFAVAALLELTGPIELPGDEGEVSADNAAQFFLKDQYDDLLEESDNVENQERIDQLEIVSTEVFERLLEGELPPPTDILDLMGPLVERGSIAGYAVAPQEQDLLEDSGIAGTLVDPEGSDGLAITYNNAIGNKIDFFFRSSATYTVDADTATGVVDASLELNVENRAPSSGQPFYVIGNGIDEPLGSNRTLVSIYSQLPSTLVTIDGEPVNAERSRESGYHVTGVVVELAAGETGVVRVDFSGPIDLSDGYELMLRNPPLADPIEMRVDAVLDLPGGSVSDQVDIGRPGRHVINLDPPDTEEE